MVIEWVVEQATLLDTNIPKWFVSKDWNYLLSNLEGSYEEIVKEFYANALFDGGRATMLGERKGLYYNAFISCSHSEHQPTNVCKTTGV